MDFRRIRHFIDFAENTAVFARGYLYHLLVVLSSTTTIVIQWYIEQIKLAWTHVWFFWEKHEGFTNWWIYSLRLTFWGRTFALESYWDVFVVRRLTTIPLCAFLLRKCVRNCYLTAHVKISEIASPRDDKWTARNYLPIDTHRVFKDNHVWPSAAQSVLLIGVCCFASDTVSWEV